MKVMKFGGTSVGSAERIKHVVSLVSNAGQNIIVLSAMSGTTNSLIEFYENIQKRDIDAAKSVIDAMKAKYAVTIDALYSTDEYKAKATDFVENIFDYLTSFLDKTITKREEKMISAQGELMSTNMVTFYMHELGYDVQLLPALEIFKKNNDGEPDMEAIIKNLKAKIAEHPNAFLYITQGFICRDIYGDIDNLERGGSDYSASLAGAAINAEEIQIWTDIDGMHNNDPRFVENTHSVRHLHFDEAAELAYFGAKILHPTCILPAKLANIPVRLLNTMDPQAEGTLIDNRLEHGTIKAVAAKDNITIVKIRSSRMLLAYGFLRKVFEIFETYKTSIDVVSTSEVEVSMTIDDTTHLNEIVDALKRYGTVSVDIDMCILCVVGDMTWQNIGFETRAMDAMMDIPVRLIAYGGSNYNISFIIRKEDKIRALRALSAKLFN